VETLLTALSWDVAMLHPVPVFKAFRTGELWVRGFYFKKIKIQKIEIIRLDYFFTIRRKDILNH
jgi:hypothetical protein